MPGRPVALVVLNRTSRLWTAPRYAHRLIDTEPLELFHLQIRHGLHNLPVWIIRADQPRSNETRELRIHLTRIHMEREALRVVLRQMRLIQERLMPETDGADSLQHFLDDSLRFLMAGKKYGRQQAPLLDAAYSADELIAPGERESLLVSLNEMRRTVRRRVEDYTTRASSNSSPPAYTFIGTQYLQHIEGEVDMSDYDVHVGGDLTGFVGSKNIVKDSIKITQAANVQPELAKTIEQLAKAVQELLPELPEADRAQATRDFETLRDEAAAEKPRKPFLTLAGEALSNAAKIAGEVGAPVLKLVQAVIELAS